MKAEIRLTRPFRLADAARPYEIVVDGEAVATVRNHAHTQIPVSEGSHTVQVHTLRLMSRRPGLSSAAAIVEVGEAGGAEFIVHPPRYPQAAISWIRCHVLGPKEDWIQLVPTRAGPEPRSD